MNIIVLNLIGVAVMVFIVWWFWLSKPKAVTVLPKGIVEIRVKNGVYDPAQIQVKLNEAVTLRFIREDANPCAERVIFPAFNISKNLSLHGTTDETSRLAA